MVNRIGRTREPALSQILLSDHGNLNTGRFLRFPSQQENISINNNGSLPGGRLVYFNNLAGGLIIWE